MVLTLCTHSVPWKSDVKWNGSAPWATRTSADVPAIRIHVQFVSARYNDGQRICFNNEVVSRGKGAAGTACDQRIISAVPQTFRMFALHSTIPFPKCP